MIYFFFLPDLHIRLKILFQISLGFSPINFTLLAKVPTTPTSFKAEVMEITGVPGFTGSCGLGRAAPSSCSPCTGLCSVAPT